MKAFITVFFLFFFTRIHSQDTIYLHGADRVIGKVVEVDDDGFITFQKSLNAKFVKEKIKQTDIKAIRYKGGRTERYQASKSVYIDTVQLMDAIIFYCKVLTIGDDSISIDTENEFDQLSVPIDSIASISYRSGRRIIYNNLNNSKDVETVNINRNKSLDSVNTIRFINKLTTSYSINKELADGKDDIEIVKNLFDRFVNDVKYREPGYDSIRREIAFVYCSLLDEVYFTGNKINKVPSGKGELFKPNGELQSGEFVNGKLSGYGKITYSSGNQKKEGNFVNGELNGEGIIIDSRGRVKKGFFVDDQLSGEGSITYTSGAYQKGTYLKGMLNGEAEKYFPDNNFYKGAFKNAKYNGKGLYHWADQNISYEGIFVDGKRNGKGLLTLPGGIIIKGEWKNDCPDGKIAISQQTNGDELTATWIIKDCNIESKKKDNQKINFDDSLVFIKMTEWK